MASPPGQEPPAPPRAHPPRIDFHFESLEAFERTLELDASASRILLAGPSPLPLGVRLRLHIHVDASGAEIAVPAVAVDSARLACPAIVAQLVRWLDAIHATRAAPAPAPAPVWRFFQRFRPRRVAQGVGLSTGGESGAD